MRFRGVIPTLMRRYRETSSERMRDQYRRYMRESTCDACGGRRLRAESLAVRIGGRGVAEVQALSVRDAADWFKALDLGGAARAIAEAPLREIRSRLEFLAERRARLPHARPRRAHAVRRRGAAHPPGEPARQRAVRRDVRARRAEHRPARARQPAPDRDAPAPRDLGNSVLVVEHDEDTIRAADHVVDFGPGAGHLGGKVVFDGPAKALDKARGSLTADYLSGRRRIEVPKTRRSARGKLTVRGARANNLKGIDVTFPLGCLVAVTGPSGAGKSSLVNGILLPALAARLHGATDPVGEHRGTRGTRRHRQGDRHRPAPDRPHAALEPGHVHQGVRRGPQRLRRASRRAAARLGCRTLQLQREGRPLRGVRGRRRRPGRDALLERRVRDVRGVRRKALRRRDARREVPGQEHRRRARDGHRRMPRAFRRASGNREDAPHAVGGRARLREARPAGADVVRRRSAAHQAFARALARANGPNALRLRRADDGPSLRRRTPPARGAQPARSRPATRSSSSSTTSTS